MGFPSRLSLMIRASFRKFAFFIVSALAMMILFLLIDRSHRVIMLTPHSQAETIQNFVSISRTLEAKDPKSTGKPCTNYEVYLVLSGNVTGSTLHAQAEVDLVKQLLTAADCRLVEHFFLHVLYSKSNGGALVANETSKLFADSIQRCAQETAIVELNFVETPDGKQGVSIMNKMMREGYVLRNIDYVSVLFASEFSADVQLAPIGDILNVLGHMAPKDAGVVFQQGNSKADGRFFFSRKHFEIFGFFFPQSVSQQRTMAAFLRTMYPESLTATFAKGSVVIEKPSPRNATIALSAQDLSEYNATLQTYLTVSASNPCLRCRNLNSRKVIAMSLYGSGSRYTMGAIRNAQLLPVIFPGWRLWFYVEKPGAKGATKYSSVPTKILRKLEDLGAEIVWTDAISLGLAPMLWRFTVMDSDEVDVFTVRDCDSRLTPRDAAVVADWLKTDRMFHCIRDHPSHSNYAVSGGLWGARREPLSKLLGNLRTAMQRYGAGYVEDMNFLGQDVWPKVKDHAYCHDSYSCQRFPSSHPFPVSRIGSEHLGEVYDEHSVGRQGDINILLSAPVNKACVPS